MHLPTEDGIDTADRSSVDEHTCQQRGVVLVPKEPGVCSGALRLLCSLGVCRQAGVTLLCEGQVATVGKEEPRPVFERAEGTGQQAHIPAVARNGSLSKDCLPWQRPSETVETYREQQLPSWHQHLMWENVCLSRGCLTLTERCEHFVKLSDLL